MSDTARNAARSAADTARDVADQATEKGEQVFHQAADQAQRQAVRLGDVIRGEPVLSALVAVAIGCLLGSLIAGRR